MEKQLSVPSCQLPVRQREGEWLLWVLAAGSSSLSACCQALVYGGSLELWPFPSHLNDLVEKWPLSAQTCSSSGRLHQLEGALITAAVQQELWERLAGDAMLSQRCQSAEQGCFGGAERLCMCPCGFSQMNLIRPGGSCHGKDLQRELRVSCCSWPDAVIECFF